ncbi:MAG: HepT-like ribonuclease domain-containing protein [Burkholderiaceae bacterium]
MRNALAHGYFTVDQPIVWQTVQQDLPDLKQRISAL